MLEEKFETKENINISDGYTLITAVIEQAKDDVFNVHRRLKANKFVSTEMIREKNCSVEFFRWAAQTNPIYTKIYNEINKISDEIDVILKEICPMSPEGLPERAFRSLNTIKKREKEIKNG